MNKIISFILFLSVFLTLYGLLHLYFYRKVLIATGCSNTCHMALILVLGLLLLSPIIANLLAVTSHSSLASITSDVTYTWMGGLFLYVVLNLLIDIYTLIIHVSARLFTLNLSRFIPGDQITLVITLLIITGIVIYGRFEAGNIVVEKITLDTQKLPEGMRNLRIVQISDVHFSPLNGKELAGKICGIIKEQQPDILVSSGDLIDRGLGDKHTVAALFNSVKTTYGKFATTGNHEFISGIDRAAKFTEKAGFRMLRNEAVAVNGFLNILAIDDPAARMFGNIPMVPEDLVLEASSPDRLNIFLKHQPRIDRNSPGRFDVQLSGHTHKGQIFPFNLVVSLFYPYINGLYRVGRDSHLYVSRGTGTWGPPFRFLAPPEITVIDFQNSGRKI